MSGTVLIVEDDADIRDSLAELIQAEGYDVTTAVHGRDALDKLEKAGLALPKLILLDLMMPIMDGIEFRKTQLQHSQWRDIPVVVMSADANVQLKLEKAGAPLSEYLRKPINLEEIVSTVARFVGKR